MRIELKAFYWRLVAANGRTLAHSEQYSSRSKAKREGEDKECEAMFHWMLSVEC